jgi:hypothetical protein
LLSRSVDTKSVTFKPISGGKNNKYVSGVIPRLVPDQEIYLYFEIENKSAIGKNLTKDFIKEIFYKGGKGKLGVPKWSLIFSLLWMIPFGILIWFVTNKIEKWLIDRPDPEFDQNVDDYHEHIIELVQMASNDAANKIPIADFTAKVDEYLEKVEFRKTGLKGIALKQYKFALN